MDLISIYGQVKFLVEKHFIKFCKNSNRPENYLFAYCFFHFHQIYSVINFIIIYFIRFFKMMLFLDFLMHYLVIHDKLRDYPHLSLLISMYYCLLDYIYFYKNHFRNFHYQNYFFIIIILKIDFILMRLEIFFLYNLSKLFKYLIIHLNLT